MPPGVNLFPFKIRHENPSPLNIIEKVPVSGLTNIEVMPFNCLAYSGG